MGCPKEYPVYWDKILLNASQVTQSLHRPTAGTDGDEGVPRQKPQQIERDTTGRLIDSAAPARARRSGDVLRHVVRLDQL